MIWAFTKNERSLNIGGKNGIKFYKFSILMCIDRLCASNLILAQNMKASRCCFFFAPLCDEPSFQYFYSVALCHANGNIEPEILIQEHLRKKLLWEGNSGSALGYEVSDPPPGLEQGP